MRRQIVDVEVYFSEEYDEKRWYYKFYAYFGNSEVQVKSDIAFRYKKGAVRAAYAMAEKLGVEIHEIIDAYL